GPARARSWDEPPPRRLTARRVARARRAAHARGGTRESAPRAGGPRRRDLAHAAHRDRGRRPAGEPGGRVGERRHDPHGARGPVRDAGPPRGLRPSLPAERLPGKRAWAPLRAGPWAAP